MAGFITANALQRIGGVLGAVAIAAGAYGSHGLPSRLKRLEFSTEEVDRNKAVWATAASYHLLHSAVLLGSPLFAAPHITGPAILVGMLLFSGSCYAVAFTGDRSVGKLAPVGGMLMIAGWASIALL